MFWEKKLILFHPYLKNEGKNERMEEKQKLNLSDNFNAGFSVSAFQRINKKIAFMKDLKDIKDCIKV